MATVLGIDTGSWRTRVAAMDGSFRRFVVSGVAEVGAAVVVEIADGAEVGHEDGGAGEGGGAAVVHREGVFPR